MKRIQHLFMKPVMMTAMCLLIAMVALWAILAQMWYDTQRYTFGENTMQYAVDITNEQLYEEMSGIACELYTYDLLKSISRQAMIDGIDQYQEIKYADMDFSYLSFDSTSSDILEFGADDSYDYQMTCDTVQSTNLDTDSAQNDTYYLQLDGKNFSASNALADNINAQEFSLYYDDDMLYFQMDSATVLIPRELVELKNSDLNTEMIYKDLKAPFRNVSLTLSPTQTRITQLIQDENQLEQQAESHERILIGLLILIVLLLIYCTMGTVMKKNPVLFFKKPLSYLPPFLLILLGIGFGFFSVFSLLEIHNWAVVVISPLFLWLLFELFAALYMRSLPKKHQFLKWLRQREIPKLKWFHTIQEKFHAYTLHHSNFFLVSEPLWILVLCILLTLSVFGIYEESFFAMFTIPASILVLVCFLYWKFQASRQLRILFRQIYQIHDGTASRQPPLKSSAMFYSISQQLAGIFDSIQTSVARQIAAERTKMELVTNVSHDLKTPLTSIISYINLLGDEELSDTARDYVRVLDRKSQRLKSIVSDLFDLAKAAGGTEIPKEKLDMVMLVNQIFADMDDRIAESGKELRVSLPDPPVYILANGIYLYRVLQNLLGNALKYSMEGTRIFFSIETTQNFACMEMKNVSAVEMDFTAEEITERFTRGDKSRSEEGNGLGLAIAKSFTEVCGGQLAIEIDGDIFTARVCFPRCDEQAE